MQHWRDDWEEMGDLYRRITPSEKRRKWKGRFHNEEKRMDCGGKTAPAEFRDIFSKQLKINERPEEIDP